MDTCLRAVEVWVPSADGTWLEHDGGWYGAAPALAGPTRGTCFGRAEGLPGRAWDDGRPMLLAPPDAPWFRRRGAARDDGLAFALALPQFVDGRIASVAVLLGGDRRRAGAPSVVELWRHDPRVSPDLTLAEAHHDATPPAFEALSRDGGLARGFGAPGLAWQREGTVLVPDIASSAHFLRAEEASRAGLARALAMPCGAVGREVWVLALLWSASLPMARRIEAWRAEGGGTLVPAWALDGGRGAVDLAPLNAIAPQVGREGAVADAWRRGVAQVRLDDEARALLPPDDPQRAEVQAVLTLPLPGATGVDEVVAIYL